jgi:transcriptional regulator of heat shock response
MEYQKVIPLVKYLASHMSKLYQRRKWWVKKTKLK